MFYLQNIKYKDILYIPELNFEKGKITSILGESGSGKTCLLKLLNQIITQDEGEIYFNGTTINGFDPVTLRRKAVMLPQTPIIFPGTIEENLNLGIMLAENHPITKPELTKAFKFVKLSKSLEDEADKLSGGEKQRLAIARIILMEPEVLLLDEPSSALDEDLEVIIISKLIKYARDNDKTVIMVTHSRQLGKKFADIIVNLKMGHVQSVEKIN